MYVLRRDPRDADVAYAAIGAVWSQLTLNAGIVFPALPANALSIDIR